jgi:hypothetical protein
MLALVASVAMIGLGESAAQAGGGKTIHTIHPIHPVHPIQPIHPIHVDHSFWSHHSFFTKTTFHWSHYCWSSRFGCYFYWYNGGYYYWYAPQACYLPIIYIDTYAPTAVTTVVPQVVDVQNQNGDGSVVYQAVPTPLPASYGAGPVIAVAN